MEEIDLKEIFNMIWKKKVDIIIIVLAFFILGFIYTLEFVSPVYESSVTLVLVSAKNNDNTNATITTSDITLNSKLISTYKNLIKSTRVVEEVISNLELDMSVNKLKGNISVSAVSNTELIKITIKDENPEQATRIANETAKVFKEKVKELYNISNIELMGEASQETEPTNINHKKDITIFTIVGIIFALVYITAINMFDTTIKKAETIETEFDLPVLASIPLLRRKE